MALADNIIFLLTLAASLAGAIWTYRHDHREPPARLAVAAFVGIALGFTLLEAAALWLAQTGDPWNAARLAPAIALHHGYTLYYPLHEGPVLSTVVGPVAFLAYWPVGFLPGSPTTLILAACALNVAAFAAFGTAVARRIAPGSAAALLAWLVGAQLVLHYPALRYSLFSIHADAPALLLGGLGVALGLHDFSTLSWRRATATGLCLALAVWSKQSLAAIFPAVLALVWLRAGRAAAGRFVVASLLAGLLISCALIGWLGFQTLRDNMLVVPSRHPWLQMSLATGEIYPRLHAVGTAAHVKVFLAAGLHLVRDNWPLFALLGAAVLNYTVRRSSDAPRWPRTHWAGFLLVALCMFPTAALGRTKLGGEVNHESFVVFFLLSAILCWLLEASAAGRRAELTAALAVMLLVNAPRLLEYDGWRAAWSNQNETAYRYEVRHPAQVYFPWNPLTSLLAEGKLYHFDYGVFDRNLGGARVSPGHLAGNLPARRPVIASYPAHHDHILHTYFPDYRELPADSALPGWRLYGPP